MRTILSILSAMGGRAGWRWWSPVAVFLGLTLLTYLWAQAFAAPGEARYFGTSWAFLILVFFHSGVQWQATPFALSLGHRRGDVYLVAAASTILFTMGAGWAGFLAAKAEFAVVGPDAPRLFAGLEVFGGTQLPLGPLPSPCSWARSRSEACAGGAAAPSSRSSRRSSCTRRWPTGSPAPRRSLASEASV